ncbi:NifU family protein [Pararhodospirillum oryzae]|uniref:Iron transporter n=1 Tax=Pararhodospirillum oryzae TaxID=478448 RepID=A0A512H6X9_9PROT|nr:NifU family protein [Pararhodospirillum oryzae]GEO81202.1 iron transporter [Pararhodospirillum oryzae]
MFIQTEATPNPASLKFLPGRAVLPAGGRDFADARSARVSPLATRLFDIEGVSGVFLGPDFITVTKSDAETWTVMKPLVLGALMDHFAADAPVLDAAAGQPDDDALEDTPEEDREVVRQILDLLETRVRPVVAQDGGDIVFHAYRDGVVQLFMRGSCSGCPSSTATLKRGVETLLRHHIPAVRAVEAVR